MPNRGQPDLKKMIKSHAPIIRIEQHMNVGMIFLTGPDHGCHVGAIKAPVEESRSPEDARPIAETQNHARKKCVDQQGIKQQRQKISCRQSGKEAGAIRLILLLDEEK